MNLNEPHSLTQEILKCKIQDSHGLNDVQKIPDKTTIAIDQVGIERFRLPISLKHADGTPRGHDAEASMSIPLKAGKTGVNMSRFCLILQEEAEKDHLSQNLMRRVLHRFRYELRDFDHESPLDKSFLTIQFRYPVKQTSLSSGHWGWQYYEMEYEGMSIQDKTSFSLKIKYEYCSTCPCSLSLAKQYEKDYQEGKTQRGVGVASPHAQRSVATVQVYYDDTKEFSLEDLIQLLRTAIPTETQSLVKRIDEQSFAILNGENPMFVEHVARRLALVLNNDPRIWDWNAKIEHLESLHSHNAVATIRKPLSSD